MSLTRLKEIRLKEIPGGVTAPAGFVAGSIFAGIKASNTAGKPDIALVFSQAPAVAAGTFTTNNVKAAPVKVSQAHVKNACTRAIVANSGNANACTGAPGIAHAKAMTAAAAKALGIKQREVLVCSTGRIGTPLPIAAMEKAIAALPGKLSTKGSLAAAKAIMTSDTRPKEVAMEFQIGRKKVRIGGIAKGAGMIDPNMATMLAFVTTDAVIDKKLLQKALLAAVQGSFNRITIDGDMSTNDTVLALANGAAGNAPLKEKTPGFELFQSALAHVCCVLARKIVEDGEGVTKFVTVHVRGARNVEDARKAAEAVANSTLVKCCWFGGDPNWGRVMDAVGYSGCAMREEKVDVYYDSTAAVKGGVPAPTPQARLKAIAKNARFAVTVDLHMGKADYTVFTTDLSTAYVEFNMGE